MYVGKGHSTSYNCLGLSEGWLQLLWNAYVNNTQIEYFVAYSLHPFKYFKDSLSYTHIHIHTNSIINARLYEEL